MLSRFWVMSVNWLKIGPYIEQSTVRNTDCQYGEFDAIGVNIGKEILPMRGNISEKDFSNFFLVPPRHFAYNPRGSRKLGLGYNATPNTYIITFNDVVFRVKPEAESVILPEFLFLYLSRKEWDRKAEYLSWGSSTEVFSWETLCDVEIPAPSIKKQRELVATWKGLRDMKEQNEAMAAPLMQLCQSRLQELKHKYPLTEIGPYIEQCDERNSDKQYGVDSVMGVSIGKKFISTKADMTGVSLTPYKLVKPNEFCFVTVTSRNGGKISLALNQSDDTYIVSSSYEVFRVIDEEKVCPGFLYLWFCQSEFDRYARFHSWGSARETFSYESMERVEVPLPSIKEQQAIVNIYKCAAECKRIADEADRLSREICPALMQKAIRG